MRDFNVMAGVQNSCPLACSGGGAGLKTLLLTSIDLLRLRFRRYFPSTMWAMSVVE